MMLSTYLPGCSHRDRSFDAAVPTATLQMLTHDPRNLESEKYLQQHPYLAKLAEERETIQRPFKGQKKANVPKYREYLIQAHNAANEGRYWGAVPTITLWTPEILEVRELRQDGPVPVTTTLLVIPHNVRLIAIDGETQLAARWEGAGQLMEHLARVTIHYGKPVEWAISAFVDLNTKMIAMNKEMAITKSIDDVLAEIARDLSKNHRVLCDRVKETDTTILQNEHYWMTLGKLRVFVGCVWRGKPGVAIGSKPVLQSNFKADDADVARLRDVCRRFWDAVGDRGQRIIRAFEDRKGTVIGAPAVLAALGAIVHECGGGKGLPLADNVDELIGRLNAAVEKLSQVRWDRDHVWAGFCGRMLPPKESGGSERFRISGGAKDGVYDVYRALYDESTDEFLRVRESRALGTV